LSINLLRKKYKSVVYLGFRTILNPKRLGKEKNKLSSERMGASTKKKGAQRPLPTRTRVIESERASERERARARVVNFLFFLKEKVRVTFCFCISFFLSLFLSFFLCRGRRILESRGRGWREKKACPRKEVCCPSCAR